MIADGSARRGREDELSSTMPTSPSKRATQRQRRQLNEEVVVLKNDKTSKVVSSPRRTPESSRRSVDDDTKKDVTAHQNKISSPEDEDGECKQQFRQTIQTIITAGSSTFDVDLDDVIDGAGASSSASDKKTSNFPDNAKSDVDREEQGPCDDNVEHGHGHHDSASSTIVVDVNVEEDFMNHIIMNQRSTDTDVYDFNMEDMDIQIEDERDGREDVETDDESQQKHEHDNENSGTQSDGLVRVNLTDCQKEKDAEKATEVDSGANAGDNESTSTATTTAAGQLQKGHGKEKEMHQVNEHTDRSSSHTKVGRMMTLPHQRKNQQHGHNGHSYHHHSPSSRHPGAPTGGSWHQHHPQHGLPPHPPHHSYHPHPYGGPQQQYPPSQHRNSSGSGHAYYPPPPHHYSSSSQANSRSNAHPSPSKSSTRGGSRKKRTLAVDDEPRGSHDKATRSPVSDPKDRATLRGVRRSNSHDSTGSASTKSNSSHHVHNISLESATVNTTSNYHPPSHPGAAILNPNTNGSSNASRDHPSNHRSNGGPEGLYHRHHDSGGSHHHRRQSSSSTASSLSMGGLSMSSSYDASSKGGGSNRTASTSNIIEASPNKRSRHNKDGTTSRSTRDKSEAHLSPTNARHNRTHSGSSCETAGTHSRFELLSMDDNCSTSTTDNMLPPPQSHHHSSSHKRVLKVSTTGIGGSSGPTQTLSASPIMGNGSTGGGGPDASATPISKNTSRRTDTNDQHEQGHQQPFSFTKSGRGGGSSSSSRYYGDQRDDQNLRSRANSLATPLSAPDDDNHAVQNQHNNHNNNRSSHEMREQSFTPIPFQTGSASNASNAPNHQRENSVDVNGSGNAIAPQLSWSIMGDTSPLGEHFDTESWNSGYSSRAAHGAGAGGSGSGGCNSRSHAANHSIPSFWKDEDTAATGNSSNHNSQQSSHTNSKNRDDGSGAMVLGALSPNNSDAERIKSPPLPIFLDHSGHGSGSNTSFPDEERENMGAFAPTSIRSSGSSGGTTSASHEQHRGHNGSYPPQSQQQHHRQQHGMYPGPPRSNSTNAGAPQRQQYGDGSAHAPSMFGDGHTPPPPHKQPSSLLRPSGAPPPSSRIPPPQQHSHPHVHIGGPTSSWGEFSSSSSTTSSLDKNKDMRRGPATSYRGGGAGGPRMGGGGMVHPPHYPEQRDESNRPNSNLWSNRDDGGRPGGVFYPTGSGGSGGHMFNPPMPGGHRPPPHGSGGMMGPQVPPGDRVRNLRGRVPPPGHHPHHHSPSQSHHHHPPHPIHTDHHHHHHHHPVGGKLPHTPMSSSSWHPHPPPHHGPPPHMNVFGGEHHPSMVQMHSKRKCVPLKPPIPSKFQGDIEKFKDAPVPEFTALVNFPAHMSSKLSLTIGDGMKCCVMCGQGCPCSSSTKGKKATGSADGSKEGSSTGGTKAPTPTMLSSTSSGGYIQSRMTSSPSNLSSSSSLVTSKPATSHGTYAIIPTQNKGLCTFCDVNVWVVLQSGLEIKWCKGCKNFRPWAAFGDKGLATKCVRCRERQREKYALQKEEKERAARGKSKTGKGLSTKKGGSASSPKE